jgi:C1A family cysteine protease
MSNVPVLDQGQEGTCVTFSSTAALDAVLKQGDFISQQCSLMLDDSLGTSFWNGANMPSEIIVPLQQNGVVAQGDCPSTYPDTSATLDVPTYQTLVSPAESATVANVEYEYFAAANLASLKAALQQGHRVLIGFHVYTGSQQAVQGFNVNGQVGGLWACKQGSSPNYCRPSMSGHEVLVVGFDDSQQLLKIRNSWGTSVGDSGDYFMTYTFFSSMAIDQTIIR